MSCLSVSGISKAVVFGGIVSFMTEEPKPERQEAEAEFDRVLRNLVNTPHKPHVEPKAGTGEPAPDKVSPDEHPKRRD